MILHFEYHPEDIPWKIIRDLWSKYCGGYLSKDITNGGLENKQTISMVFWVPIGTYLDLGKHYNALMCAGIIHKPSTPIKRAPLT